MTDATVPGPLRVTAEAPDRNLALELVRVTEAAAMAAGRWVGRGDKNGADQAAVNAMRQLVSTVSMKGTVVIGEGEKDEAPMLYNGEEVGDGNGPDCDVAVDPVDGTTLCAKGMTNAIAVMAVADRGAMYDPSALFYMEKLVTGPDAAGVVDIEAPVEHNVQAVAKAKGCSAEDVTVVVLDRPRHADMVARSVTQAPGSSSSPMATSLARSWRPATAPESTCCWASAAHLRASSPRLRSSASAVSSLASSGPATTRRSNVRSTPAMT